MLGRPEMIEHTQKERQMKVFIGSRHCWREMMFPRGSLVLFQCQACGGDQGKDSWRVGGDGPSKCWYYCGFIQSQTADMFIITNNNISFYIYNCFVLFSSPDFSCLCFIYEILNLPLPHLRQLNVLHVSGTERVFLKIETRPQFERRECVKDLYPQTATYALWNN